MPKKLKTHKATAKRFKVTKNKKLIEKSCNQDHFNARERGSETRAKRSEKNLSPTNDRLVRKSLPYIQK